MSDGYDSELAMLFADYNPLVDVASSTHFRPLSTAPNPHPTEWRTTPIWHGGRDRHTPGGQEWHDQPCVTRGVCDAAGSETDAVGRAVRTQWDGRSGTGGATDVVGRAVRTQCDGR